LVAKSAVSSAASSDDWTAAVTADSSAAVKVASTAEWMAVLLGDHLVAQLAASSGSQTAVQKAALTVGRSDLSAGYSVVWKDESLAAN
jgi:hypothetical protein